MDDQKSKNKIVDLQERIRVLTQENQLLAERAEETLLLGSVAEKINSHQDFDELLKVGIEQIALMKGIPFVACYSLEKGQGRGLQAYSLTAFPSFHQYLIPISPDLDSELDGGFVILRGEDHQKFPYCSSEDCRYCASESILMPMGNLYGPRLIMVFGTDKDSENIDYMIHLLARIVDMLAARLDNIELLKRLTSMNKELDQKVRARTLELGKSEKRARTLFNGGVDAFLVIDEKMNFKAVNKEACRSLGYSQKEMLKLSVIDIVEGIAPEKIQAIRDDAITGKLSSIEAIHRRKDGSVFPVEIRFVNIEYDGQEMLMGQARDVSERNRLLEQLTQAQKMEAVGRMAGGIAHDFNNILTTIMGQVDLLKMEFSSAPRALEDLEHIQESSEKAARLTGQLLAFSRKQAINMAPVDLNKVLTSTTRMLSRVIGDNIELKMDLASDVGCIFGDPGKVEQIVMNLVINARDAMPSGGKLEISTRSLSSNPDYPGPVAFGPEASGKFIQLEVKDDGEGISSENLANIFDPFFTTKGIGEGTGLGLALVYGIAQQHNATVKVTSHVGKGSSFRVVFPEILDGEAAKNESGNKPSEGGQETILLVEDDETIRQVVSRMISRLGYNLLTASTGDQGLEVVEAQREPVDLVITDVIMPGITGAEMVNSLKAKHHEMRVIYMSGYTSDAVGRAELNEPNTQFLQKPVSFHQLAEVIRTTLDEPLAKRSG